MRKLSRQFLSLALLVTCLLLPLSSFSGSAPLRLALSITPLSLPFYIALDQGLFEAEGLSITVDECTGGYRAMRKMLQGEADLATPSEAVIMFNSFEKNDFVILATFVTTHDNVKVVAAGNSGINSPADLAGKRVGTVIGSASHYYLDTLAILNGVDPALISLNPLPPESMTQALMKQTVDAVAIWQPFAFTTLKEVPASKVLEDDSFYNLSFNLVSKRQLANERQADLQAILRALKNATQLINSRPNLAGKVLSDKFGLDAEHSDWILKHFSYRIHLEQSLISELESEARWAIRGGQVKDSQVPNYLDLIKIEPLRAVDPDAVNIVK